jgi:hypothetical protein
MTIYNVMLDLYPHNIQHTLHTCYTQLHESKSPFCFSEVQPIYFSPYYIILCSFGLISLLSTNATMILTESPNGEQVAVVGVIEEKRTIEASDMLLSSKCKCSQQNHFNI